MRPDPRYRTVAEPKAAGADELAGLVGAARGSRAQRTLLDLTKGASKATATVTDDEKPTAATTTTRKKMKTKTTTKKKKKKKKKKDGGTKKLPDLCWGAGCPQKTDDEATGIPEDIRRGYVG